ncbi:MAG TPA: hypothetical protein VK563_06210 [Puia sp.]|nr:hypothetical protein [Puia sp.]
MNSVIIFDVPADKLVILKSSLKAMGYWERWQGNEGKIFYLPNNTLWKPNCELKQAKNELENLIRTLDIPLQRCIVLSVNPWDGIEGSPIT